MPGAYPYIRNGEPTGQWQGWWEHPVPDANGKRKRRTKLHLSESAARDWGRTQQAAADAEVRRAGVDVQRNQHRAGFSAYAWRWLADSICANTTKRTRATRVRALVAEFDGRELQEITTARVREMVSKMIESGDSGDVIRGRVSVLKSVMADAVADELITQNPVNRRIERALPPSTRKKQPVRIRPEDYERVLKYVPDHLLLPFHLALDCGLRAAEVAGLQWKRIDWKEKTVLVTAVMEEGQHLRNYTKGKRPRVVPISPRTITLLRSHRGQPDEFVAERLTGGPFTPHGLSSQWDKYIRRGRPEMPSFHHLRHSLLTNLDEGATDLRTIQEIAGHQNPATTQVYLARVSLGRQREAMARLERPHLRAV